MFMQVMIKHYHYRIGLLFKYILPLGSNTFAFWGFHPQIYGDCNMSCNNRKKARNNRLIPLGKRRYITKKYEIDINTLETH